MVPVAGGTQLLAGATFEYDPPDTVHRPPDPEAAAAALLPGLAQIYPPLARARVLGAQAGTWHVYVRVHVYVHVRVRVRVRVRVHAARANSCCAR